MKHIVLKYFKSVEEAEKYIADCKEVISYRITERNRNKNGNIARYVEAAVQLPVPARVLKIAEAPAAQKPEAKKSPWVSAIPGKA